MFTYFARFHEKYGLPVYPIAVFSYQTPKEPEPDEYRIDFPDLAVLPFRFRVVQLNQLAWQDFEKRTQPDPCGLDGEHAQGSRKRRPGSSWPVCECWPSCNSTLPGGN